MSRTSRVVILLAAILVPCAALAAFGLRSLARNADEARAAWQGRAAMAAEAAGDALAAAARATASLGVADHFRASTDGALLPDAREEPPASPEDSDAAASLTKLAALQRREGRLAGAVESWTEIVERHPDARDPRGLRRSFAARRLLAETLPETHGSPQAWLALLRDVVADHRDARETATAVFKADVREAAQQAVGTDPSLTRDYEATLRADDAAEAARRVRATWDERVRPWLDAAPEDSSLAFEDSGHGLAAPLTLVLRAGRATDRERPLDACRLEDLVAAARARPEMQAYAGLGFEVSWGPRSAPAMPGALAERTLAPPFDPILASVRGPQIDDALARERQVVLVVGAAAALGLGIAAFAAAAAVRALRREIAAVRAREQFVAAVTHELKSPLASIRLLAEVLSRGRVEDAKVREFATRTMGEADRLARLVAQVLELARIESGSAPPALRALVEPAALARDAAAAFAPVAEAAGYGLSVRVDGGAEAIRGDRDALLGALHDLLDNARKYSDEPHLIVIEVSGVGGFTRLGVLDRGRGLPAGIEAAALFEPFARGGDEMTRDRPGVGLGLALVKRVVEAHGGWLEWRAREGGGSDVAMLLPVASPPGAAAKEGG